MALKYEVESLDGIDEGLRGNYAPIEGGKGFRLKLDGVDPAGLKSSLDRVNGESAARRKQIERWEKLGKTPEEIEQLIAAATEADTKKLREKGDFDALLAQHQDKWNKEKTGLEAELNSARASERSAIIENRLNTALAKAGVTAEGLDLLPGRLNGRIDLQTVDGKRVIKILQADGTTPMAGSAQDGTATFDDLVKEAQKSWPSLFKGTDAGGSGTAGGKGGAGGGSGGSAKPRSKMTIPEKAAYIREHGQEAFNKLPYT